MKTLLKKFKFEYSLTKDGIRQRNHVTYQRCDIESSSIPIKDYSVRAEQRYYGRSKQVMSVVYGRFQVVAIGSNTMPAVYFSQSVVL